MKDRNYETASEVSGMTARTMQQAGLKPTQVTKEVLGRKDTPPVVALKGSAPVPSLQEAHEPAEKYRPIS